MDDGKVQGLLGAYLLLIILHPCGQGGSFYVSIVFSFYFACVCFIFNSCFSLMKKIEDTTGVTTRLRTFWNEIKCK